MLVMLPSLSPTQAREVAVGGRLHSGIQFLARRFTKWPRGALHGRVCKRGCKKLIFCIGPHSLAAVTVGTVVAVVGSGGVEVIRVAGSAVRDRGSRSGVSGVREVH